MIAKHCKRKPWHRDLRFQVVFVEQTHCVDHAFPSCSGTDVEEPSDDEYELASADADYTDNGASNVATGNNIRPGAQVGLGAHLAAADQAADYLDVTVTVH